MMPKPVPHQAGNVHHHKPRKKRRLRTISMLPTLLTLGNLYFGFVAISMCGREMYDLGANVKPDAVQTLNRSFFEKHAPSHLSIAAWMLVAAMLCDALDGRVARKTGAASKFGEQLDTIADVVSFGVAPALIMVTLIYREITQSGYSPFGFDRFSQATALIAAVYVCCAALRLARFTVEASAEEASHSGFLGMPSPAAAAAIISLVYLHDHLQTANILPMVAKAILHTLPLCTLAIALLMVSRVPYRHFVSWFLRRRPFGHIILVLLVLPLLWLFTSQMLALIAWIFVISGPIGMLRGVGAHTDLEPSQNSVTDSRENNEPSSHRPIQ